MSHSYFCNPLNVPYHYQFNGEVRGSNIQIAREGADPSLILFQGKYYLFPSMNLSVWVSEDLAHWESHPLPETLPLYDYAPDVRVMGEYVYFCASRHHQPCNFYRTKDVLHGPYEEIKGTFDFWDPNQFLDDDGRLYHFWGCSAVEPIYGVELDPATRQPIGEKVPLIYGDPFKRAFERKGENNSLMPRSDAEIDVMLEKMLAARGISKDKLPPAMRNDAIGFVSQRPYIEGAWMTKHNGKYYLQYACSGSQFNVYADGVFVADRPLGPYTFAQSNPYSFKPGGFMPGAGHGSTLEDSEGKFWHTSTMRISVNHQFERRVGLWPAGFDRDGVLYCNQRYGDWPMSVERARSDPWCGPEWMLLSYGKKGTCSSQTEGHGPELAADENCQTWWKAASNAPGQWLQLDLGAIRDVRAIQVNFADDKLDIPTPGPLHTDIDVPRYIEPDVGVVRWMLEGSTDGEDWVMLCDKSQADTSLPHDLVVLEDGQALRYLKLTAVELPWNQPACVSGLRVFGNAAGSKPGPVSFALKRTGNVEMTVNASAHGAAGYNILWGCTPDKLYHSWMVFGTGDQVIPSLVDGQHYFVRVDAFNECGITQGAIQELAEGWA